MKNFFVLILLTIATLTFGDEYTDFLLDKSIDEFSLGNYAEALETLDEVLEKEPENTTALMYKQTIEDVYTTKKIDDLKKTTTVATDKDNTDKKNEIGVSLKDGYDYLYINLFSGKTVGKELMFEQRTKIFFGLPVVDIAYKTGLIGYDIEKIGDKPFPFEDFNPLNANTIDLAIGLRYHPSLLFGENPGFIDLYGGLSRIYDPNSFLEGENTFPFVRYDIEVPILKIFGSNIIFDNIWFGSRGSYFILNNEYINNYSFEIKSGVRFGIFNIGAFLNTSKINSLDYDTTTYGIILGTVF